MGVPTSEVGYTPAMSRREDHEVHKGHVVALGGGELNITRVDHTKIDALLSVQASKFFYLVFLISFSFFSSFPIIFLSFSIILSFYPPLSSSLSFCLLCLHFCSHIKNSSMQRAQMSSYLTLFVLTWRIWWAPNNATKWQMGFNSQFKALIKINYN